MRWLLEHIQILLLLAVAVAAWLKRRAAANSSDETPNEPAEEEWLPPVRPARRPETPPPLARSDRQGQTTAATTVPKSRRQTAELETDPQLARQRDMEERLRQIKVAKATGPASSKHKSKARPTPAQAPLRQAMRDRHQLRRAIVLREILGPPVGLR